MNAASYGMTALGIFGLVASIGLSQPAGAQEDPAARFLAAIHAAAVPQPNLIDDQLVPVVPTNPKLEWVGTGDEARVKVVSWMSENAFQRYWSTPAELPADGQASAGWGRVSWVTAVPQVRDFCRALGKDVDATTNRLKQLLGLSPDWQYHRFVEFLVSPKDLFRPCPDPEIDDSRCELTNANPAPDDYRLWFVNNYANSYAVSGAPWTRLGYTYDWAPAADRANPRKPYGASEFIVRPGANYTVTARYTTAQYCGIGEK
jgi:hypothetical protein